MSSRLIGLTLFVLAGSALAQTETVTEAAEQGAEVVEQEISQAAESASDVVTETVEQAETTVENAEQTTGEMTEAAEDKVEKMADDTTQATEEAAEEVVEEAAETTAVATEQSEAAAEETQTAVEEATEQAEAAVEETAEQAEAAVEETAEQAEAATEEAAESAEATAESGEEATETAMATDGDLEAKLAACAACHGADGNSVIPQNPKLAGQVPGFIADQLSKFKSGERDNAIMTAQVVNLTDEDIQAIDAFYSSQQAQLGAISEDMQEMALVGQKIYRGGEPSMSIAACMSCHGPSGHGIPIRFPKVSGQHIEYLEQQLLAYKSGSRVSDVMNPIAFRLSEQQIKSLAAYMHALK